ncbi:MAG: hypothetical protein K2J39_10555 [Ruminococcus sp.]|nr:hypothetical protein [Ruminococcus sp.]
MPIREKFRKKIIKDLADKVYNKILSLDEGTEISISEIVREIYKEQGYKFICLKSGYGWVWTKDNGVTFSIKDFDQFEILNIVKNKLQGQVILDFSKHEGLDEGLPHNLDFIIRKNKI